MRGLLVLIALLALPGSSRAEGERRLFIKVHGKSQKLDARTLKPLVERQIKLVEEGKPKAGEPVLLFVQHHDAKLVSEVEALAKDHPVVVAAASPRSLDPERAGRAMQELSRAGARRVLIWDQDRSPQAVQEALFSGTARANEVRRGEQPLVSPWGESWVATPTSEMWRGVLDAAADAVRVRPRVIALRGPRHGGKRELLAAISGRLEADSHESASIIRTEAELAPLITGAAAGKVYVNDNNHQHNIRVAADTGRLDAAAQKQLAELIEGSVGTFMLSIDDGGQLDPALAEVIARVGRTVRVPDFNSHRQDVPLLAQRFFDQHLMQAGTWSVFVRQGGNAVTPAIEEGALELLSQMEFPQGYRSLQAAMHATANRVSARISMSPQGVAGVPPPTELGFDDLSLGALMAGDAKGQAQAE